VSEIADLFPQYPVLGTSIFSPEKVGGGKDGAPLGVHGRRSFCQIPFGNTICRMLPVLSKQLIFFVFLDIFS
jgi:hypothetical protein